MEPRRWTHLPTGTNVVGIGYVYTTGDIQFDPVLRIDDATFEMHTTVAAYTRYFGMFGNTARVDVTVPFQSGSWEGLLDGQPASVSRLGFADPTIRLSYGLVGAPALSQSEFPDYLKEHPTRTVVSAGFAARLPLGEYQPDKLINLGENRFVLEPQLGLLHTRGPWSFELTGSAFFFTDNDEFFGGHELEQPPLFAAQTHVVRTLPSGWWLSGGAAYGFAGASQIDGLTKDDDRRNLLFGGALGFPITQTQSLRLGYFRRLALEDTGVDSHNLLLSWAIRF